MTEPETKVEAVSELDAAKARLRAWSGRCIECPLEQVRADAHAALDALEAAEARIVELTREVQVWACEACYVLYPGPPLEGRLCVICPQCDGNTAPWTTVERRRLEKEAQSLRAQLATKRELSAPVWPGRR